MNPALVQEKVKNNEELRRALSEFKQSGKRIVHCHGCFDLLHPGHIKLFQSAREQGDILVVTLTSDRHVNKGPGRPVYPQEVRAEFLASLEGVDLVSIIDHPLSSEAIKVVNPDVYVKGADGADESESNLEHEAIAGAGGRIHYTEDKSHSSSSLLNRYFDVYPEETQLFLNEFRSKYAADDIVNGLEKIRNLKVLIIGDAVIDEYHYVRPMGKTSKANIIATRYLNNEMFSGGVFACANHLAGFCDNVHVVSALGTHDTKEDFIRAHLKPNVTAKFVYRDDCPTTVKKRYVDANFLGKLFEVYYFEDRTLPDSAENELRAYLEKTLSDYDVVISLDYAHGLISPQTVKLLSRRAKYLAVNTQTNAANIGYNSILKYPTVDFVCIDEPELRLATWDRFGPIEPLLKQVVSRLEAKQGIVTRGHRGCVAIDQTGKLSAIPVLSQKVVDAVGAGDAFLAVAAPCAAVGLPMDMVGFIGNTVGAQAVKIVGNRESVEPSALINTIKTLMA